MGLNFETGLLPSNTARAGKGGDGSGEGRVRGHEDI